MLKTNVYDMSGKLVGEIELSEAVFGISHRGKRDKQDTADRTFQFCRKRTFWLWRKADISALH